MLHNDHPLDHGQTETGQCSTAAGHCVGDTQGDEEAEPVEEERDGKGAEKNPVGAYGHTRQVVRVVSWYAIVVGVTRS